MSALGWAARDTPGWGEAGAALRSSRRRSRHVGPLFDRLKEGAVDTPPTSRADIVTH